jgi:hypothetical protein
MAFDRPIGLVIQAEQKVHTIISFSIIVKTIRRSKITQQKTTPIPSTDETAQTSCCHFGEHVLKTINL